MDVGTVHALRAFVLLAGRSSIALELGDVGYVVERGPHLSVDHVPVERAVEHRISLARALSYVAQDDKALAYLLKAEEAAPQLVRHSASVRETVRTMHRRASVSAGKDSPLLGLAERC